MNNQFFIKLFKYFVIFITVSLVSKYIPSVSLDWSESIIIGSTAAVIFALLDMYSPSVNASEPDNDHIEHNEDYV